MKTIKKSLPILFIFFFALLLGACSNSADTNATAAAPDKEIAEQVNAALLSGYPQDVLPLFQPDSLISCSFSYRSVDQYDIGKDIYSVTYQSIATQQDLINYYSALFSEKNDNPSVEGEEITDKLSGKIGANSIEILFLDNEDSTTTVYLTLGLSSAQYTEENPYFSDYPADIVDAYGQALLLEITYEEQYYGEKTDHYFTVYQTDATMQAFTDYYNRKYASKNGFTQTASDTRSSFSWQDQGFDVDIAYSGGSTGYVTIDVSKAG